MDPSPQTTVPLHVTIAWLRAQLDGSAPIDPFGATSTITSRIGSGASIR
jgi:hypothetical protein